MSALFLLGTALCVFVLAYRYYSAFIAAKVLMLDDRNIAPSYSRKDGRDYIPTNKWVVFGHHFAAIAGPGPLIGPTLAAQYGWGPGFFWILLGSVFAGCVQDMITLFGSVRHGGQSLAHIAKQNVSRTTGIATAIVILFLLVIVLAALGVAVVNALFNNPWGVFSIGMTIPIAMVVGIYMFKIKPGAIISGSIVGVILVCAFVFLGEPLARSSFAAWFTLGKNELSIILPAYGFLAATLPVWLLLVPRDYLSTYMKIGVVAAMAIGLLFMNPQILMPFTTKFTAGGGPIIPGPVWPYVFITIACGAISGFHSLVSSGVTPKIIEKESQIPMIGYGAMLTEAFVALMALIAAVTLNAADYFAINTAPTVFQKLNMTVVDLNQLNELIGLDVSGRPGGAISLAVGMAHIFANVGEGLRHTMKYWFQFIIMFEALFILTVIDAGTRLARYILQEAMGTVYEPLKKTDWIPGIILTSTIVTFSWGYLLFISDISTIWPLLGITNQTFGVLSLAIATNLILRISKKKYYALITVIPCCFVMTTTSVAAVTLIQMYYAKGMMVNFFLSISVMVLAIVIVVDNIRVWISLLKEDKPIGLNDGREKIYYPDKLAEAQ